MSENAARWSAHLVRWWNQIKIRLNPCHHAHQVITKVKRIVRICLSQMAQTSTHVNRLHRFGLWLRWLHILFHPRNVTNLTCCFLKPLMRWWRHSVFSSLVVARVFLGRNTGVDSTIPTDYWWVIAWWRIWSYYEGCCRCDSRIKWISPMNTWSDKYFGEVSQ